MIAIANSRGFTIPVDLSQITLLLGFYVEGSIGYFSSNPQRSSYIACYCKAFEVKNKEQQIVNYNFELYEVLLKKENENFVAIT